ncbi:Short chain dehydrogenase citE [Cladobotryum mycophilum]|uniref:Short chain dehydrogenase citE n=1 Tax=Cladobotryum mycophilum TaxID=491253 RepID=A0ABR0SJJ0_9HYPO
MQPPRPSPTPTWHNDTYPAISPSRPEISASGKRIIITGAGSGIGRETALAFAAAGASYIALLGRTKDALKQTAASLPASASSSCHVVDITRKDCLATVAATIGTWDVLVLSAGYISAKSTIQESNFEEFWQSFETNTKGTYTSLHAFLPTANPSHATVLAITSGTTTLPPSAVPGLSAYTTSKLAQIRLIECLAAENKNVFAATVHPGLVETTIFAKSGAKKETLPMDKVQLPAHFVVWLSSPEAAFLNGRSVWANWDVDELKAKAKDIQQSQLFTSCINGWPYSH